jgi:hypothetical protein
MFAAFLVSCGWRENGVSLVLDVVLSKRTKCELHVSEFRKNVDLKGLAHENERTDCHWCLKGN